MARYKMGLLASIAVWATCAGIVACGPPPAPAPPAPGGGGMCLPRQGQEGLSCSCPRVPDPLGECSDFHIMGAALSCGGDGRMTVVTSSAGGASRFTITLAEGSKFQGSLVHHDPPCNIRHGTKADFTFGAVYTGDQGEETVDGATRPCIVQSKVDYSSFNFDLFLMAPQEGTMKAKLHESFDREIIAQVFGTPGAGRCQRWRQMP